MADTTFVREEMIAERRPPASTLGAVGWLRENLFSSWFSGALTAASLAFIVWLAMGLIHWTVTPTWEATSLRECRDLLAALGREGHFSGACWGVIRDRWVQLLFGFYPSSGYWRPILALLLMAAALAPVLFSDRVPRRMLIVTALYPFVAPWLLWGGSAWTPVLAFLGFPIGYFTARRLRLGAAVGLAGGVAAALVWWWLTLGGGPAAGLLDAIMPLGLEPVESRNFGGFMLSVTIGVASIAVSLPLGILLALGRRSDMLIVKTLCVCFIEFIRGVPLITLLFVASTLLNIFMPPGTNFDIILRVIIMATLFSAAYVAEVIRGGLAAIPTGQTEAANSLGLSYWQSMRLIIMPQALKISIPGIVGTFIGLFKDTTLVSVIGLLDPLGLSNAIRADAGWNGIVWELYGFIAVLFFVCCYGMSRYAAHLERKLQVDHRR